MPCSLSMAETRQQFTKPVSSSSWAHTCLDCSPASLTGRCGPGLDSGQWKLRGHDEPSLLAWTTKTTHLHLFLVFSLFAGLMQKSAERDNRGSQVLKVAKP